MLTKMTFQMKIIVWSRALIWVIILCLIIFTCLFQCSLRSSQISRMCIKMSDSLIMSFSCNWACMLNLLNWCVRWISSYFSDTNEMLYLHAQFRHWSCAWVSMQQLISVENSYVSRVISFMKILVLSLLLLLLQMSSSSAV